MEGGMNMALWICMLALAIFFDYIVRIHTSTIVRRHQFRLYAVRDELRAAAIRGEIDPRNWVYQYLDSSIAKTITHLGRVTIWLLLSTYLRARKSQYQAAHQQLVRELEKPQHSVLKQFQKRYEWELLRFLLERHLSLRWRASIAGEISVRYLRYLLADSRICSHKIA
jgi:hypothetical protein